MNDAMLTVSDVAARLKVPEQSVRRWLRDGRMEGIRLGGTKAGWRIEPEAVERFLDQARQVGKVAA
jgi:excisionase family DNA binding protein